MVLSNIAEGTATGTTVTTSNSGGVAGNAFTSLTIGVTAGTALTFDNTQFFLGSTSYKVNTSANTDDCYMDWGSASVGTQTLHWGRFYYYTAANPAAEHNILNFRTGAAAFAYRVTMRTDGKLRIIDAGNVSVGSTTNAISLNAWNRIEWMTDHTNGISETQLFNSGALYSTVPTETLRLTGLSLGTNVNELRLGKSGAQNAAVTEWYDNILMTSNGYPGPAKLPYTTSNYQFPSTGDGMSVTEKVR